MADNYLEKKQEELRSARPVIRRVNASLDSLLSEVGKEKEENDNADRKSEEKVKAAQFEALRHSAERLKIPFSYEYSEQTGQIKTECADWYSLGGVVLAIRLKAAELKLRTTVSSFSFEKDNNKCLAIVKVSKY